MCHCLHRAAGTRASERGNLLAQDNILIYSEHETAALGSALLAVTAEMVNFNYVLPDPRRG
jgi:hypothetical protein